MLLLMIRKYVSLTFLAYLEVMSVNFISYHQKQKMIAFHTYFAVFMTVVEEGLYSTIHG